MQEYLSQSGCESCALAQCGAPAEVPECNGTGIVVCNSLASATSVDSVSPASVSQHHPTTVVLGGEVGGGDLAKWVESSCQEEGVELPLTPGLNISVVLGKGQMGSALMGSLQISCFSTEGLFGYSRQPTFIFPKVPGCTFSPNLSKLLTSAVAP